MVAQAPLKYPPRHVPDGREVVPLEFGDLGFVDDGRGPALDCRASALGLRTTEPGNSVDI